MTIKVQDDLKIEAAEPRLVTIAGLPGYGCLIGSEYINGKPGRDRDILFTHSGAEPVTPGAVEAAGFTLTSEPELYPDSAEFFTARKGEFNLIVCLNHDFFFQYRQAARACRLVVLYTGQDMDKGLRVALHRLIADQAPIRESLDVGREVQERQA